MTNEKPGASVGDQRMGIGEYRYAVRMGGRDFATSYFRTWYHLSTKTHTRYLVLLRGTILNRTYGAHKNLYISLFLTTIFGPINNGSP